MIEFIWDIVVVTNDCMKEDVIYHKQFCLPRMSRLVHAWLKTYIFRPDEVATQKAKIKSKQELCHCHSLDNFISQWTVHPMLHHGPRHPHVACRPLQVQVLQQVQPPLTMPLILQPVVGPVLSPAGHVLQQSQVLVTVPGAGDDLQLAQNARAVKKKKEMDQSDRPQLGRKNVLTGLKL